MGESFNGKKYRSVITKKDINTLKDEKYRLVNFFESDALTKMQEEITFDNKLKCGKDFRYEQDKTTLKKNRHNTKLNHDNLNITNEQHDDVEEESSDDSDNYSLQLDEYGNPEPIEDVRVRKKKQKSDEKQKQALIELEEEKKKVESAQYSNIG